MSFWAKPKRRWFQFNLGAMLILVAVAAGLLLAWRIWLERREQQALAAIRGLAESLANQNKPPAILGSIPEQRALFAEDYDWAGQERILLGILLLINDIDRAWPILAEFLGDERYCITFQHDMSVRNYSVDDVCWVILVESLTEAYMRHIPRDETAFRRLRHPEPLPRDRNELKTWCLEQRKKGRRFYQLQIDMCESALERLPSIERNPEREWEFQESTAKIRAQIEELRTTKKPVRMDDIIKREFRWPYSEGSAAEVRKRLKEE